MESVVGAWAQATVDNRRALSVPRWASAGVVETPCTSLSATMLVGRLDLPAAAVPVIVVFSAPERCDFRVAKV